MDLLHQAESGESDWMSSRAWSCWRAGKIQRKGGRGWCCRERIRISHTSQFTISALPLASPLPLGKQRTSLSLSSVCFKIGIIPSSEDCFHGLGSRHVQSTWQSAQTVVVANYISSPPALLHSFSFLPSLLLPFLLPSLPSLASGWIQIGQHRPSACVLMSVRRNLLKVGKLGDFACACLSKRKYILLILFYLSFKKNTQHHTAETRTLFDSPLYLSLAGFELPYFGSQQRAGGKASLGYRRGAGEVFFFYKAELE